MTTLAAHPHPADSEPGAYLATEELLVDARSYIEREHLVLAAIPLWLSALRQFRKSEIRRGIPEGGDELTAYSAILANLYAVGATIVVIVAQDGESIHDGLPTVGVTLEKLRAIIAGVRRDLDLALAPPLDAATHGELHRLFAAA
ncbi:MAG: hypothetical protein RL077_328 [Verrucomicrobiota bacterium]|jgi:hypothetical protein